jgi:uncharacterized membrane protein YczE
MIADFFIELSINLVVINRDRITRGVNSELLFRVKVERMIQLVHVEVLAKAIDLKKNEDISSLKRMLKICHRMIG